MRLPAIAAKQREEKRSGITAAGPKANVNEPASTTNSDHLPPACLLREQRKALWFRPLRCSATCGYQHSSRIQAMRGEQRSRPSPSGQRGKAINSLGFGVETEELRVESALNQRLTPVFQNMTRNTDHESPEPRVEKGDFIFLTL